MKNYILFIAIAILPILGNAQPNYQTELTCRSLENDYAAIISVPDSEGNRIATISWLREGKLLSTKIFDFTRNKGRGKLQKYTYIFPDGAGESYLSIFETPYYWLGKPYIAASLSGLLFGDSDGSGGINLECSK